MTLPSTEDTKRKTIAEQYGRLVSYAQACPGLEPLDFVRQAAGQARFYWENDRDGITLAGSGAALELTAWGPERFTRIEQQARELFQNAVIVDGGQPLASPRLFGGFAFRDDFTPDNTWAVFSPAQFVLPHYQLTQVNGETWLTINAQLAETEDPEETLAQLREALKIRYETLLASAADHPPTPMTPISVDYPMPYDTWERTIGEATRRIKAGELTKVVLSRVCEIRFGQRVDVDSALAYLKQHYADCYRFLFEPTPRHAFYGATPELLAAVSGSELRTMALAASIRRGKTPEEDDNYANQLLNDPKERHEHDVVVQTLRQRLTDLTSDLHVPDAPGILRLSNIQHLYSPIHGTLRQANGVLPMASALHPTPAMGGSPREVAMTLISELEPVPRGWYAAPIGWIDHNLDGMFGVAIRSAVSQDKRVWMYAGVGIVADSIPRKEWDETALKFRPMLNALGIQESLDSI